MVIKIMNICIHRTHHTYPEHFLHDLELYKLLVTYVFMWAQCTEYITLKFHRMQQKSNFQRSKMQYIYHPVDQNSIPITKCRVWSPVAGMSWWWAVCLSNRVVYRYTFLYNMPVNLIPAFFVTVRLRELPFTTSYWRRGREHYLRSPSM